ncbi:ParB N-terminal domain-containing protein [Candidatus Bathyarchaeota archaeon]|nr:ParB N-terminal domain-containing protein [Candidatus Bathyarchaeota archaeon]
MSEVLTVNLKLEQLETDVFSPRKSFSDGYIEELAESIEREGQLKPIIVRAHPASPCNPCHFHAF